MKTNRWFMGTLLVFICAAGLMIPRANAAPNVIPNPSFEEERNGDPAGWEPRKWDGQCVRGYAAFGHTGKRSVKVTSEEGGDAGWSISVPVEPMSTYKLSCWIKTENVVSKGGKGALVNVHELQLDGLSKVLTGTNDWTLVEMTFDTGTMDRVLINCLLGGWGLATGTAWFDDMSLELVGTKEFKPSAVIDAGKTREPISKFIYGQFIEHLGRCIYGGIWAEMLEDRKFFYPVGDRESPWQIVGDAASITMVKEGAYVGEHTPVIQLDGAQRRGIVQAALGLVKDQTYVGRIVVAGDAGAAPIEVSLVWGDGPKDRDTVVIKKVGAEFKKEKLNFKSAAETDNGRLEIVGLGKGTLKIGTVSIMPSDNINGMRKDTLALLQELNSPIYRWPGGNFVSGYNWKDGIGDPDKRPPRKNPAWTGVEHNDFGMHEYMYFCEYLKTEPFVTINTGLGTVEQAKEEAEYIRGSKDTPMGKWRAENSRSQPFNCTYWAIGNEMYGGWQLGNMPIEQYVEKHNKVADAIWSVDPKSQLVAVGDVGRWDEMMLTNCADHINLVSEHFYCGEQQGLIAHVAQIPNSIQFKSDAHRNYRKTIEALKGKNIRIAMDEWNYWYGPHPYGELGTQYFLKDALGIAAGVHEYTRNTDIVFMANYAQTVNVIGCIKTTKTHADFDTTGLVLKLYRNEYGVIPVGVAGDVQPLDVAAALTTDKKILTVGVVNPTKKAMECSVEFKGVDLKGKGKKWVITGPDEKSCNVPGEPRGVDLTEEPITDTVGKLEVGPMSVTLFALELK